MDKPLIFISYSHKDEEEKDHLLRHLAVLQQAGLFDLWSDRLDPGADWKEEIDKAIAQAKVAILLITANYLTTPFILDKEIPFLLQRYKHEGLEIFPVIARACAWEVVGWLTELQVRPIHKQPVWRDNGLHSDEDLTAIVKEIANRLGWPLPEPVNEKNPPPSLPPADPTTRAGLSILLKKVETSWIKGVLEKSLYQAVLLDLGKEIQAEAIEYPWEIVLGRPDQANQLLPAGTRISTLFEEMPLLLILGEPGSGKTITLLELARDLIAKARADPIFSTPIPVIFNLST